MKHRLKFLIFLITLFCSWFCVVAAAETIEIRGSFSLFRPGMQETHWTDFTVWVSDTSYQVSNYYFNGECLMSGANIPTNSYFLNKMATVGQNRWELGNVTIGRFPSADASAGQLCWLAFASTGYFTNKSSRLPIEAFQQNREYLKYEVQCSTTPPFLPSEIKWYGSNFWFLQTESTNDMIELPYTNGFLAGEYIVNATTNVGSLELPVSFEFSTFIPTFMGNVPRTVDMKDVTLTSVLRCRVTQISTVKRPADFRPPLGPRAQITDNRIPILSNKSHLSITRMNGKWPEINDNDFKQKLSIATLSGQQLPSVPNTTIKRILLLVIAISSGMLIVLLISKVKRCKRNENQP